MGPLILADAIRVQLIEHALADAPIEACGVLVGPAGAGYRPARHIPMVNAAASTSRFECDTQETIDVWQAVEDAGDEVIAVYHSHPDAPAYPSVVDKRWGRPDVLHVIVSPRDRLQAQVRAFDLSDGGCVEVGVLAGPPFEGAGSGDAGEAGGDGPGGAAADCGDDEQDERRQVEDEREHGSELPAGPAHHA